MSDQKEVQLVQEQFDEFESDHSKRMKRMAAVTLALSKLSFYDRNHDKERYSLYDERNWIMSIERKCINFIILLLFLNSITFYYINFIILFLFLNSKTFYYINFVILLLQFNSN
jgi:hypothetical protein